MSVAVELPAVFRDPVVMADTARLFRQALARCRCPQECPCGRGPQAEGEAS